MVDLGRLGFTLAPLAVRETKASAVKASFEPPRSIRAVVERENLKWRN
jgi:hypothetical protein